MLLSNEELIIKLKELKKEGYTYKLIANQIGIKESSLYDFVKNKRPAWKINIALNEYFEKMEE